MNVHDIVNCFCFQWLFQWCYFWPLPYCSNWSHGAVEIQDTEKKGKQENTLNFQNRPKRGRAKMIEKYCEHSNIYLFTNNDASLNRQNSNYIYERVISTQNACESPARHNALRKYIVEIFLPSTKMKLFLNQIIT